MRSKTLLWAGLCALAPAACAPTEEARAGGSQPLPGGLEVVDPPNPDYATDVPLGELELGAVAEHVVRLRNREQRPLAIKQVNPGCSCTVPVIAHTAADGTRTVGNPHRPGDLLVLPAGEIAELTVAVDTRLAPALNAPKRILVRVETDSASDPFLTLEVHFTVVFPFQIVPPKIDLGQVAIHGGGSGAAEIAPFGGGGERILGVLECPPELDCELVPDSRGGIGVWALHARWLPPLKQGHQSALVKLRASGPGGSGEGRPVEIRVEALGVPDVSVHPSRLVFPPPDDARPYLARVELAAHLAGHKLKVRDARILGAAADALQVLCQPIAPDEQGRAARIEVQLYLEPANAPPAFAGTLRLEFEDGEVEPLEIPYVRLAQP